MIISNTARANAVAQLITGAGANARRRGSTGGLMARKQLGAAPLLTVKPVNLSLPAVGRLMFRILRIGFGRSSG